MTIQEALKSAVKKLENLQTPNLDSEVLLSYVLKKSKDFLLTNPDSKITDSQIKKFNFLIEERRKHKPIAYLIKNKEFYGRDFYVNESTHIPRPTTEDMIDLIKKNLLPNFSGTIADIGAGSGCIAITLALEYPQAKIIATDISKEALKIAERNAKYNNAKNIQFKHGDLLNPLRPNVDIIVSNPPYGWPNGWSNDLEIKFQPRISYESGQDGLDSIKKIINNLGSFLKINKQAYIEFDPRQADKLKKICENNSNIKKFEIKKDLSGFDRILVLKT